MDYFRILGLSKEPFSNTPDPESFYPAPQHAECLRHLELAVRMRRGLNVVIGEIGVGKSTVCRHFVRRLSAGEEDGQQIETHLILDPSFGLPREFLATVASSLGLPCPDPTETDWQIKERIKDLLLKKGVTEKKIVVLIIDEAQKLPDFCLEILREFLNYETNEYKLLQIILFAQPEFARILNEHASFADRINHHGFLGPMSARESAEMIRFRIAKAASGVPPLLFTRWALFAIHRATGGYPRKVMTLCHQLVLAMIFKERAKTGWFSVRSRVRQRLTPSKSSPGMKWPMIAAPTALMVLLAFFVWNADSLWQMRFAERQPKTETAPLRLSDVLQDAEAVVVPPPALLPLPQRTERALAAPSSPPKATSSPAKRSPAAAPARPAPVSPSAAVSPPSLQPPPAAPRPAPVTDLATATPGKMPEMLGQLTVRKDGSVMRMVRKIYGVENLGHLTAVALANPHIDNINIVPEGKPVNFPALPVSGKVPSKKGYRVQIAKTNDLKRAYALMEVYPPDLPATQLVPYWNSREGLVFALLLRNGFTDGATALRAKMQLPPSLAMDADVREAWDQDTVFFAMP